MLKKNSSSKNKQGSALVVALFILAMILISALSITLITVKERKASIGSSGSNRAYQASETGIESVMQLIMKGNHEYIDDGGNSLNSSLVSIGASCVSGLIEDTNYKVELLDNTGNPISCDANNTPVSDIVKIKSVGESSNSKRAVEALVSNKNTKLLMHFNGEDPPIDSSYSYYGYSINNTGSVSFSSSNSVLNGTEYAEFSAGKYLEIEATNLEILDNWNLSDKDFTIDTWVKLNNPVAGSSHAIISRCENLANESDCNFYFNIDDSCNLNFFYSSGGSFNNVHYDNAGICNNNWHHLAFERKGSAGYFFIDGTMHNASGGSSFGTNTIRFDSDQNHEFRIGINFNSGSPELISQFIGNMDELRITKGVARYPTSGFTRWENVEYVPNI